jgi:hypothetical protein
MNLWLDGFGRYGGNKAFMLNGAANQAWAQVDTHFTLSTANPRTGAYSLRLGVSIFHTEARRVFGAQLTEVFVALAVNCAALPVSEPDPASGASPGGVFLAQLRDQANENQLSFFLGTDGAIVVYQDGTLTPADIFHGTLLDRSIPVIGTGGYHSVEIYALIGNAGAFEVRVDEVTRLNRTGVDTQKTANAEASQWAIGQLDLTETTDVIDFADCYANDTTDDGSGCNTFVGDAKCGLIMVDADTAQADFALSSGATGYSLINEIPPVDASYITTTATAARSDFALAAPPANLTEILTARPFIRAWKDDAGSCLVAPNIRSGGSAGTVTAQPITTAPAYYDSNVPQDPDVSAPWALASLSAAHEIVERTV